VTLEEHLLESKSSIQVRKVRPKNQNRVLFIFSATDLAGNHYQTKVIYMPNQTEAASAFTGFAQLTYTEFRSQLGHWKRPLHVKVGTLGLLLATAIGFFIWKVPKWWIWLEWCLGIALIGAIEMAFIYWLDRSGPYSAPPFEKQLHLKPRSTPEEDPYQDR